MRAVLLSLTLLALAACSGDDEGTANRTDDILALTGDTAAGQSSYDSNCASCHAADGSGGTGPAIAGAAGEEVVEAMLFPEGAMPSFESMGDQEIADIAAYVGSL